MNPSIASILAELVERESATDEYVRDEIRAGREVIDIVEKAEQALKLNDEAAQSIKRGALAGASEAALLDLIALTQYQLDSWIRVAKSACEADAESRLRAARLAQQNLDLRSQLAAYSMAIALIADTPERQAKPAAPLALVVDNDNRAPRH